MAVMTEPTTATAPAQYALTPEQEMIRRTVREFADKEVAPGAARRDQSGEYPADMFPKLLELGLVGLPFPEQYGGADAGLLTSTIVVEELTRACYNTSYLLVMTWQPFFAILEAGTEEQRARFLPPLARGELKFSTAATEPAAGSVLAKTIR